MDFGSWSNNSVKRQNFRRLTKIIIESFDQLKSVQKFGQLIKHNFDQLIKHNFDQLNFGQVIISRFSQSQKDHIKRLPLLLNIILDLK